MKKTSLLSAASAIALAVSLNAAPADAFDKVKWNWNNNVYTNISSYIDFSYDFVPTGFTQVERLQLMAGNMSAYADGSYADYSDVNGSYVMPSAPIYITQNAAAALAQSQDVSQANTNEQEVEALLALGKQSQDVDQLNKNAQLGAAIAANIVYVDIGKMKPYYVAPIDARKHLAKVEIGATAISNIASVESEQLVMAHDGQIAVGGYVPLSSDADSLLLSYDASTALGSWLGYYPGNTMYDTAMLERFGAQYGLNYKGYNTAVAYGDYISDAQLDVSATAAANIHTVSVETRDEPTDAYTTYNWHGATYYPTVSDNAAIVDLTQFGYMDTTAVATATHHSVSGYNYLGKIDGPILSVNASALGNVSSVVNKLKVE